MFHEFLSLHQSILLVHCTLIKKLWEIFSLHLHLTTERLKLEQSYNMYVTTAIHETCTQLFFWPCEAIFGCVWYKAIVINNEVTSLWRIRQLYRNKDSFDGFNFFLTFLQNHALISLLLSAKNLSKFYFTLILALSPLSTALGQTLPLVAPRQ